MGLEEAEQDRDRAVESLRRVLEGSGRALRFKRKHRDYLLDLLAYRIDNLVEQVGAEPEAAAVLILQYVSGLQEETIETVDTWIVSMLRKALLDLLRESDNAADGVEMFKAYVEYVAERAAYRAGYDLLDAEDDEGE